MVCPRGAGAIRAEALWLEPDRSVANCAEHPGRNTVRQPFGGDSTYIDLLHPALPTWPAPQAQGSHSRHRRRPSGRCLSAVAAKPAINRHSPCRSPACWRSQRGLMPASFRRSRQPAIAWSARGPFASMLFRPCAALSLALQHGLTDGRRSHRDVPQLAVGDVRAASKTFLAVNRTKTPTVTDQFELLCARPILSVGRSRCATWSVASPDEFAETLHLRTGRLPNRPSIPTVLRASAALLS